jgi:flagellar biosynthesis chaperone FliJ
MQPEYQEMLEKAKFQYDAAFHLLTVTYPLIKDPKLLLGIISNLFTSMESAMSAILSYERQLRLVPNYYQEFQSKFNIFRYKSVKRNKIPQDHVNLMMDLKEIIDLHKKSPIEFKRQDRFVICGKDYTLRQIQAQDIRIYLDKNKAFLNVADRIVNRK